MKKNSWFCFGSSPCCQVLFLALAILLLAGCANPLYKPSKRLSETVLPEYKAYVKKDKKLTKEQKARRLKGVDHYERLLRDYRKIEGN